MYQKILVPLDGSELAECSLENVRTVATGCGQPEVELIFVSEPPPPPFEIVPYSRVFSDLEKRRSLMKDYLHKIAGMLKKDGVSTVRTVIVEGDPAEKIMGYAVDNGVDLIIMSTHGDSGPSRWAFGSVADRVTRYSVVPVLITVPKGCRLTPEEIQASKSAHVHGIV